MIAHRHAKQKQAWLASVTLGKTPLMMGKFLQKITRTPSLSSNSTTVATQYNNDTVVPTLFVKVNTMIPRFNIFQYASMYVSKLGTPRSNC
jgi:hypothetical protein